MGNAKPYQGEGQLGRFATATWLGLKAATAAPARPTRLGRPRGVKCASPAPRLRRTSLARPRRGLGTRRGRPARLVRLWRKRVNLHLTGRGVGKRASTPTKLGHTGRWVRAQRSNSPATASDPQAGARFLSLWRRAHHPRAPRARGRRPSPFGGRVAGLDVGCGIVAPPDRCNTIHDHKVKVSGCHGVPIVPGRSGRPSPHSTRDPGQDGLGLARGLVKRSRELQER